MTDEQLKAIGQLTAARQRLGQAIGMILTGASTDEVRPMLACLDLPRLPYQWEDEEEEDLPPAPAPQRPASRTVEDLREQRNHRRN